MARVAPGGAGAVIFLVSVLFCVATAATPPAPAALADSGATAAPPAVLHLFMGETTATVPADSLGVQLERLAARRDRLGETNRRVFDELIAAAWQMIVDGDWEAATLITADARKWVEKPER